MANIFVDYVSDRIIIQELKQYHAYNEALQEGVPRSELPKLPQRSKARRSLLGIVLFSLNSILLSMTEMLNMVRAQEWFAKNSIRNDMYSSEPMACSIHKAYTKYGLARLAQNDVVSAIQSLSYSAKIHPCVHTTTLGLSYELRNKLLEYEESEDAIELYDIIAWRFGGQNLYLPQDNS